MSFRQGMIDPRCTCPCHEPNHNILCCGAGSGCCSGAFKLRYDPRAQMRINNRNIAILGDNDGSVVNAIKKGQ
jgi:3-hydroxy-3-methylglutaryl CoA synthase